MHEYVSKRKACHAQYATKQRTYTPAYIHEYISKRKACHAQYATTLKRNLATPKRSHRSATDAKAWSSKGGLTINTEILQSLWVCVVCVYLCVCTYIHIYTHVWVLGIYAYMYACMIYNRYTQRSDPARVCSQHMDHPEHGSVSYVRIPMLRPNWAMLAVVVCQHKDSLRRRLSSSLKTAVGAVSALRMPTWVCHVCMHVSMCTCGSIHINI